MNKRITRTTRARRTILIGISIAVLALVAVSVFIYSISSKEQTKVQVETESEIKAVAIPTPFILPAIEENGERQMLAYLKPFYHNNDDTIGYLKIDNTIIDYPVVNSGDNEFYMTHNFDKAEDLAGAVFMDFRVNAKRVSDDRNVILYGHRMRDGTMFKDLTNYENKKFFYENQIISFDTLYEEHEWEVFAAFKTHIDFYYIQTYFETDEEWLRFLEKCHDLSKFETDIKFYPTDTILTLSTCTSSNNDKRWVVMARLID